MLERQNTMAKQTANTVAATPATVENVGRWARETARAAQGAPRAGNRFYGMAIALIGAAPAKGATARLTFAEVNAQTGKKRGEGAANPRAAWVRALSAIGELHGAPVENGALVLATHSGRVSVRIADDNKAFELRGL